MPDKYKTLMLQKKDYYGEIDRRIRTLEIDTTLPQEVGGDEEESKSAESGEEELKMENME